jgi:iron complex transport system ATP-binding protein
MLAANHVSLEIDGVRLVREVSIQVQPGQVTAIMGPNGAGKSTLLRLLAGDVAPDTGSITFDGQPLENVSIIDRARRRAVVPQRSSIAFGFSVLETVLIGRYPHGGDHARTTDIRIARHALTRAGVAPFESRLVPTLSGGELARVMLARALAQIDGNPGAAYLLLDEVTGALDPAHQHHVLRLLRDMARENGVGVLIILHDLNLAARYADAIVLMRDGLVTARGSADEVLTPALIAATFDVEAVLVPHPSGSRPVIVVNG